MLYREIIHICSEILERYKSNVGQRVEYFSVKRCHT